MSKRTNSALSAVLLLAACALPASALPASFAGLRPLSAFGRLFVNDREQDGLTGPVRRVKTETAKITVKGGRPVEGPRVLLETATYDGKGAKVDNAYFLAAGGSLTGKEVYKYDSKGNIVEMTLQKDDGTLLSKETYAYEFDSFGNWTKMTTSVAILEGGKVNFEPTEVSYRTISYFMDETSVAKMSQPAPVVASAAGNPPAMVAANPATANPSAANPAPAPLTSAPAPQPAASDKPKAVPASGGAPTTAQAAPGKGKAAAAAPSIAAPLKVVAAAPNVQLSAAQTDAGPFVKPEGEAPARPTMRGPLKPISGGVLNGRAINLPAPSYPEMARRANASGVVTVAVVIDVNGMVISAKAEGGPALLHAAAEKAAMQARFSPTLLSGQPVKVSGVITYNFTLR